MGAFTYGDGSFFDGEWLDGRPHGAGVLTRANGDVIECQFVDSLPHGQGWKKTEDGSKLGAEWDQGKLIAVVYGDGGKYKGDMRGDKRWGIGHMTFPDGTTY